MTTGIMEQVGIEPMSNQPKGFKTSQLGSNWEMSGYEILNLLEKTPWKDRVYDIKISNPIIEGGGRVVTARVKGYEDESIEWVIATIRGNDFVMVTSDEDENKLVSGGFATPEMIEVQGIVPVGKKRMKQIAMAVKDKVKKVGYKNLPAYLGGRLGKEIEVYMENALSSNEQKELQSHVLEEALPTHMDFAELPTVLAKTFPEGSDVLPMGWPMSLREEFFELNQGKDLYQYVSMIQAILYENYTETTDQFVLEIWNKLALKFFGLLESKRKIEPEKYSRWFEVTEALGMEAEPYQIMRAYIGNLGFIQFLAGHRSVGIPVANLDSNGNLVEDEFAPAEFSVEYADALNLSFMNVTVGLLSASNPIAWGEQIVNAGDARIVARNIMSTTYPSEQTLSIEQYNKNIKQGITRNLAMTFTRAVRLVKDETKYAIAAGQHATIRERSSYSPKNQSTGERPQRIELVSPSQTWAYWDDMALDFLSQSMYMLALVALSNGVSVQRYLMQQFDLDEIAELEQMLMSSGNEDLLRDYSKNGQDVKWLPLVGQVWNKVFEILKSEFPDDEYIIRGIDYAKARLKTVLEDKTPDTLEEYIQTKKGRAWEAILNEYNSLGRNENAIKEIEYRIQKMYTSIGIAES